MRKRQNIKRTGYEKSDTRLMIQEQGIYVNYLWVKQNPKTYVFKDYIKLDQM